MKKNFYILFILLCLLNSFSVISQVGINTTTPKAQLDIKASNAATPEITDGLLIPRLDVFPSTNPGLEQQGMLIYLASTSGSSSPGFYYWDNTTISWLSFGNKTLRLNDLLDANSDNDGTKNGSSVYVGLNSGDLDDLTDNKNVGLGFETLKFNINGSQNIALGYKALSENVSGNNNVGIGFEALKNTTANRITSVGTQTLSNNTTGNNNIAFGYQAMQNNTIGYNNQALGYQALQNNISGVTNQASGFQSLRNNTTGSRNTAFGYQTLYANEDGTRNTALGTKALQKNTSGNNNLASGYQALQMNTTGVNNTALGYASLLSNTQGINNTSVGYAALNKNTDGDFNVASGFQALYKNVSSSFNSAFGFQSLKENISGEYNSAFGYRSLYKNVTGVNNVAMGNQTLFNNVSGINNTAIGYKAFFTGDTFQNSTAIGYNTSINASNQVRLGDAFVNSIGGFTNWTNVSDARFKKNVKEDVIGLNFIKKLRPVSYQLDMDAIASFNKTESLRNNNLERNKFSEIQTGFIAQEVEVAAKLSGFNFHGVDVPKNENSNYGLRYAEFVVPLVKAVQEQQELIENQQQEILDMKLRILMIEKALLKK